MGYRIGQKITGTVTGIQPYGVFVSLDATVQGSTSQNVVMVLLKR